MSKIYKVLGKKGRITIPFEIRLHRGFACNDIISFEEKDDCVIVKREKICDGCVNAHIAEKPRDETTLLDFLDSLTNDEQYAVLSHLAVKWAKQKG